MEYAVSPHLIHKHLISSSLQDGATKWQYFLKESPPTDDIDFFFQCCEVSQPQLFPPCMCGFPLPSICFSSPQSILLSRMYVQCPPSKYRYFPCNVPQPNVVWCFVTLGSALDSKLRIWQVSACLFSCQSSPTCISVCGTPCKACFSWLLTFFGINRK